MTPDGVLPSFSQREVTKCARLLHELEKHYGNGKHGGLLGAVRDRKLTPVEYKMLKSYVDWDSM